MLKRKHARLCMVLMVLTILFAASAALMYDAAQSDSPIWGLLGVGGSAACAISMIFVKIQYLKCPECSKGCAHPQWRTGNRYHCTCCGGPFVYDDEAEMKN